MSKRKNIFKVLGDTEYALEQWGLWRMTSMGVPRYSSPMYILMRDNVQQSGGVSYCITDDLAMTLDNYVAKLIARDKTVGDMLWYYFAAKWPAARVGKHYGVGESKAREMIKIGVGWIDSKLEDLREAA